MRYHGKGTAAPVTHASSHKRGKNSDTVYYCTWCNVIPNKQQPLDADSYKHCTSYIITFCAPLLIHVIFCLLLWKQGWMYQLTFHALKHTLEAVFSHKYHMIWHARRGGGRENSVLLFDNLVKTTSKSKRYKLSKRQGGRHQTLPVSSLTSKQTWHAFKLMCGCGSSCNQYI